LKALVCILDDNPIHINSFETVVEGIDSVRLKLCESEEDKILLDSSLCLIMINMEHSQCCTRHVLHKVLQQVSKCPVLCYSAKGGYGPVSYKEHGGRLFQTNFEEVVHHLRDFAVSGATGPAFPESDAKHGLAAGFRSSMQKVQNLSPRQIEIFCLLGKGFGSPEIANDLICSKHTVNTHIRTMGDRLGLNGTMELRRFAQQYARTSECRTFIFSDDHICSYLNQSVGTCPVLRRPKAGTPPQR
jgi:DNA-binding NarL/FixJ family response regulator